MTPLAAFLLATSSLGASAQEPVSLSVAAVDEIEASAWKEAEDDPAHGVDMLLELARDERVPAPRRGYLLIDASGLAGQVATTGETESLCAVWHELRAGVPVLGEAVAEQATKVEEHLERLGAPCVEITPPPSRAAEPATDDHRIEPIPPPPPGKDPPTQRGLMIAGGSLLGLGVASLATSVATFAVWRGKVSALDDLTEAAAQAGGTTPAMDAQADALMAELALEESVYKGAIYGTITVGSIFVATGVATLVAGQVRRRRTAMRASVSPTFAGFTFTGQF